VIYPDVRMPISYRHHLIQELIDWKPDVIHSQCEFFSLQFALRISKLTGTPIVHTYHTLYEQYVRYITPSKRLGKFIVRTVSRRRLKRVERVVVPTHKVEDALLSYGLHNPINVVPTGISLEQHKKRISPEKRLIKRQALGIAEDDLVLLNLGRLGNEKNLNELMDYFAEALKHYNHLIFLIVGDGPAKEDLEKQADELGISKHVIFTGMVSPSEVQDYYQLGDIFVSASTSETQGLTYVEAAANGLPLLCRKDLCLKDVIMQSENGYQYTNIEEFLTALDAIIKHPQWRVTAGKRSEEIAATFDKSTFGDAIEAVYEMVTEDNLTPVE